MRLPIEQYVVLDGAQISRLGNDVFKLTVPRSEERPLPRYWGIWGVNGVGSKPYKVRRGAYLGIGGFGVLTV